MMSLETEINVHVIGCTEHIEIFRIKRLVSLITFILVLQQTNLFITAGLDILVVEQVLYLQARLMYQFLPTLAFKTQAELNFS